MKIFIVSNLLFFIVITNAFSQNDDKQVAKSISIFEKITNTVKDFKPDTTTPPNDKITHKIIELRVLKGGFNISEAIDFKLEEDKQKKDISIDEYNTMSSFFKSGNGKRWLDNAVTWIYRKNFTYPELKQVVKFYKTPGGKKMAEEFPIIMLQSLAAAESIRLVYNSQKPKK